MGNYTERFGPIETSARTKKQAKLEVQGLAIAALNRLERPPLFILGPSGVLNLLGIVVYPTNEGYSHLLVDPSGDNRNGTQYPGGDYSLVVERAIQHLAEGSLDGSRERLAEAIAWLKRAEAHHHLFSAKRSLVHNHYEDELRNKNLFLARYNALRAQGETEQNARYKALEYSEAFAR